MRRVLGTLLLLCVSAQAKDDVAIAQLEELVDPAHLRCDHLGARRGPVGWAREGVGLLLTYRMTARHRA